MMHNEVTWRSPRLFLWDIFFISYFFLSLLLSFSLKKKKSRYICVTTMHDEVGDVKLCNYLIFCCLFFYFAFFYFFFMIVTYCPLFNFLSSVLCFDSLLLFSFCFFFSSFLKIHSNSFRFSLPGEAIHGRLCSDKV